MAVEKHKTPVRYVRVLLDISSLRDLIAAGMQESGR